MMNKAITLAIVVFLPVFTTGGCIGRAIKEGVGTVRGARGIHTPLTPVSPDKNARPLGQYSRFELGTMKDSFGGKVPRELFAMLPLKFEAQRIEAELPNSPTGKVLLIRGEVFHYEDEDLVGEVLGPLEEVVARVEMVDKDTGKVIATANCVGRTMESVNKGVEKKADGLAKAIVSWIKSRYPETE
ncbi:MAG TPA: hypothetical protein VMZ50_09405 [Phycisphaerae bacterium]|nr:hypothetical protein [Phycisphaerae bacterium]